MEDGLRSTLTGHVESAVWHAALRGGTGLVARTVAEAIAGFGFGAAEPVPESLSWAELAKGDVDWAALVELPAHHPGLRHVGTAALLHAARTGVLRRLFDGPVDPAGHPELAFGVRDGWCTPGEARATAELRTVAGAGQLADPGAWLEARLVFDSDWFWAPLASLCEHTAVAASFGAPGRAGGFRAASARVNTLSTALRARPAQVVADALARRPQAVLEIGAVSPVWGTVLGGRRTVVDYPEVLAVVRPDAEHVGRDPLDEPPEGAFDVVVVDELLHTAPAPVAEGLLRAAAGRLAPGGVLIVVEPLLDDDRTGPTPILATQVKVALAGGDRMWTAVELVSALRAANLRPSRPRLVGGMRVSIARN